MDFFVLRGADNLLGRLALQKIWPAQYKACRDIASEVPVGVSSANTACDTARGRGASVRGGVWRQQACSPQQTPLQRTHPLPSHGERDVHLKPPAAAVAALWAPSEVTLVGPAGPSLLTTTY